MKYLYVGLVSVLMITVIGLILVEVKDSPQPRMVLGSEATSTITPTVFTAPVKIKEDPVPGLTAVSAVAIDVKSGEILLEKNPTLRLYPASTTKLATALVAMDYYPLDRVLRVSGIRVDGQKMKLVEGEMLTVADLLRGLLMFSANDAAEVLAKNFPGGEENFVTAMNLKVAQLQLSDTSFTNPTGLDNSNQFTTAFDLAKMAKYAVERPFLAEVVKTKNFLITSTDGKIVHKLTNINELLGKVDGVLGVKTGWTENAKENLVTYVDRNGAKVIFVVLGSEDRFGETTKIIDWVYTNYKFN